VLIPWLLSVRYLVQCTRCLSASAKSVQHLRAGEGQEGGGGTSCAIRGARGGDIGHTAQIHKNIRPV
jgi:hypothetical protein